MGQRGDGGSLACPFQPRSEGSCVVSLFPVVIMFLPCRLIIDPGGSVGPRGTGCDSDWKLVLLQPGLDTLLGGTPSVCSCISLTT